MADEINFNDGEVRNELYTPLIDIIFNIHLSQNGKKIFNEFCDHFYSKFYHLKYIEEKIGLISSNDFNNKIINPYEAQYPLNKNLIKECQEKGIEDNLQSLYKKYERFCTKEEELKKEYSNKYPELFK